MRKSKSNKTSAREFTHHVGGEWRGTSGTAACPICQPEGRADQRDLYILQSDDYLLLHCFAGGCDFRDILAVSGIAMRFQPPADADDYIQYEAEQQAVTELGARQSRRLWRMARPINGSIAAHYLRNAHRITCPLPTSLRFDPACWHRATGRQHPALIARVDGAEGYAVYRTYLKPDGSGKAGLDGGDEMPVGSIYGGAVRLANGAGPLIVGTDIAATFKSFILYGDTTAAAWACLSTAGIRDLRLPLPSGRLIIAPDGDLDGMDAALSLAKRAMWGGWVVSIFNTPFVGEFDDTGRNEVTP